MKIITDRTYIDEIISTLLLVAQGDYHAQVKIHDDNEDFDALAMGINMMIDNIRLGVETVEKEKAYANNIISSITDIFIILNPDQTIRYVNDKCLTELGYTLDELYKKNINNFFGDEPVFSDEDLNHLVCLGSIRNIEKNIHQKNNTIKPVLFSASSMKDKEDNISAFICIARDITEQKAAEKKLMEHSDSLEKVNKELDQFAYVVSHDLKAPLRAITNLSQWIEEDLGDNLPDEVKSNMSLLRGRVARMQSLIEGILSYSKVGRTEVKNESVDVEKLINDILSMVGVPESFKIIKETAFPVISADRVRLEQVFANLISNAIKYHDKSSGNIVLGCKKNINEYEFSVADDGPGIPEEYHEKIFVIFQTLEARDKKESTGVGLSIVKKIIEENGGSIRVESASGRGAKFVFTWPELSDRVQEVKI